MARLDDETQPPLERTAGRGIVVAGDRTHSFRQAKRHSSRVRILKYALPVSSLLIAGVYGASVLKRSDLISSVPQIEIPNIVPENLTMDNPHYEGFGKDGSAYSISAKTALQDLSNTSLIKLDGITGLLSEPDKRVTELVAAVGVFDTKANVLELEQAIDIKSESGLRAKLSRATVNAKDGIVTSKEPVVVEFPGGSVHANSLTLRQKARETTFADAVKARLQPKAKDGSEAAAAQASAKSGGTFGASGAPVDITADRLDIKDNDKTALFSGNVVAVQADQSLSTPELKVYYDTGRKVDVAASVAAAIEGAKPALAPGLGAGKVSRIAATGPVTMTRGATDRVTSSSAEFDPQAATAVLAGQVVMTSGTDRSITADRADLDSNADTALLTGSVIVRNGKNELKGKRLFVNRRAQQLQLTSPGGGRVAARFTQAQPGKGKPGKAGAAAPAGGFATFKTDPNAPVDIEADQLSANDSTKTATFSGDVKAVQGGFVIRTPELVATYAGEAGLGDVPGAAQTGQPAKPAAQLNKIEARKKVLVTSQDGQKVSGDWAIYDTAADTVTVGGDVILSQGSNVVRGTRLVIDMTSGNSTIETAAGPSAKSGQGGWAASGPAGPGGTPAQGRPSAVFFPDQLKEMRGGGGGNSGSKPADPWKPSTSP